MNNRELVDFVIDEAIKYALSTRRDEVIGLKESYKEMELTHKRQSQQGMIQIPIELAIDIHATLKQNHSHLDKYSPELSSPRERCCEPPPRVPYLHEILMREITKNFSQSKSQLNTATEKNAVQARQIEGMKDMLNALGKKNEK